MMSEEKYGLLELDSEEGDELGSMSLKLIKYLEEEIGVLYIIVRYVESRHLPILRNIPIKFPSLD